MRTLTMGRRASVVPAVLTSLLVVTVPVLAGCADGQNAPTRLEYSAVDGVQAHAGNIVMRSLLLTADVAVGTSTTSLALQGIIDNDTGSGDTLESVTAGTTAITGRLPSASIVPGSPVNLGSNGLGLTVTGLGTPALPGSLVSVTFSFEQAGSVTVSLPVYTLASRQPGAAAPSGPVTFPTPDLPQGFNESEFDNQAPASS